MLFGQKPYVRGRNQLCPLIIAVLPCFFAALHGDGKVCDCERYAYANADPQQNCLCPHFVREQGVSSSASCVAWIGKLSNMRYEHESEMDEVIGEMRRPLV